MLMVIVMMFIVIFMVIGLFSCLFSHSNELLDIKTILIYVTSLEYRGYSLDYLLKFYIIITDLFADRIKQLFFSNDIISIFIIAFEGLFQILSC